MFLKDDNLGLGAKRGSERAENFGLAGLESILGRLNGNEAEVKKEEERREEIEKRAFVYRKYGMMNFVSGGFLVGDKITKSSDIKKEVEIKSEIKSEPESDDGALDKKDKKRKRDDRTDDELKVKRKKKSEDLRDEAEKGSDKSKSKKDKKDKKDKKKDKSKKSKRASSSDAESSTDDVAAPASDPEPLTDKEQRKAEKKARKEEKKAKKALKKAAKKAAKKDSSDDSSSESEEDESTPTTISSVPLSKTSTPVPAGLSYTPRGMHAVRQKWIRQKKAATMDAQAMKEVCLHFPIVT